MWPKTACPPVYWGGAGQGPCPAHHCPEVQLHLFCNPQPSPVHSLSVVPVGRCHRQSCSAFRPRPSTYRPCRKARSHLQNCTAVSGAQPLQPVQPNVLHKAAASIVSLWQHSLKQLASFVRVQREPTPTDSKVCNHRRCAHVCNLISGCSVWGVSCRKSTLKSGPPSKT